MKKFDLEAAKRGDPIVTRDGSEAKFIAHVPELREMCRVLYTTPNSLSARCCSESGRHYPVGESFYDLFMASKKQTVWVNFYKSDDGHIWSNTFKTLDSADNNAIHAPGRVSGKAYPVEIEE